MLYTTLKPFAVRVLKQSDTFEVLGPELQSRIPRLYCIDFHWRERVAVSPSLRMISKVSIVKLIGTHDQLIVLCGVVLHAVVTPRRRALTPLGSAPPGFLNDGIPRLGVQAAVDNDYDTTFLLHYQAPIITVSRIASGLGALLAI